MNALPYDLLAAFAFPTSPELIEAIPVIISLIIIEGLLSVDNALAIAAMASHLPGKQKYQALKWGIIGAYLFRGLCLAFAAWIIENPWLQIFGATYFVYLMCQFFTDTVNGCARNEPCTKGGLLHTTPSMALGRQLKRPVSV
jgi:predicted tellurium resistance membrane protein TerC